MLNPNLIIVTFFILLISPSVISNASAEMKSDGPIIMQANKNGNLDEWLYLLDERKGDTYTGGAHQFESGILLLRIGEIDREVGSVEFDFWFWAIIEQDNDPIDFTIDPPTFNFINGRDIELTHVTIEPHLWEAQVKGTFFTEMNFQKFPFETLELRIEVETDRPYDLSQAYFVIDPDSGVDETAKVPGWELGSFILEADEYIYDQDTEFSRFTGIFNVERSALGSFVKFIFPISMITGLSLLIFYIPENFTPRIYLTAPLLLSLVYLHQGALAEIPPIGYMTLFDKIMLINYSIFIAAIGSLAIQMKSYVIHKDSKKVKQINNTMVYIIPIIIGVGLVIIFVTY